MPSLIFVTAVATLFSAIAVLCLLAAWRWPAQRMPAVVLASALLLQVINGVGQTREVEAAPGAWAAFVVRAATSAGYFAATPWALLVETVVGRGWKSSIRRTWQAYLATGDMVEFLSIDSRRFGVLVADVSGHGVPAALIASMVKVAAAAQKPHASDPARVLAGIHAAVTGELPPGHFVTAVYTYADLDRGVLLHASAGHPPALVQRAASGALQPAGAAGPLLISFAPPEYPVESVPLAGGDRVVLYTDGVVEAMRPDGEMFGEERLSAVLASRRDGADALASEIVRSVSVFAGRAGGSLDDDCTVVVVETTDRGDPGSTESV